MLSKGQKAAEKSREDKKAVYFMITTLTYANNFDIMKGMMNIKHIKIKISIWITTTSCGWRDEKEKKYIEARNKILPLIFYIITSFYVSQEVEGWKDFEILFFSPFSSVFFV